MVYYRLPESMYSRIYIVDVNNRGVLVKHKFQGNASASGIWLRIVAIKKVVGFEHSFDEVSKFSFTTRVT